MVGCGPRVVPRGVVGQGLYGVVGGFMVLPPHFLQLPWAST